MTAHPNPGMIRGCEHNTPLYPLGPTPTYNSLLSHNNIAVIERHSPLCVTGHRQQSTAFPRIDRDAAFNRTRDKDNDKEIAAPQPKGRIGQNPRETAPLQIFAPSQSFYNLPIQSTESTVLTRT